MYDINDTATNTLIPAGTYTWTVTGKAVNNPHTTASTDGTLTLTTPTPYKDVFASVITTHPLASDITRGPVTTLDDFTLTPA